MKLKSTNLKHIFVYTVPAFFGKIVALLLVPFYTKYLSPEEYGCLSLLLTVVTLMASFVSFGWDSALIRFLPEKSGKLHKDEWISSIFSIRLSGYVILFFFVYYWMDNIATIIKLPSNYAPLLLVTFAGSLAADMIRMFQLVFRAQQKSTPFAFIEISKITTVSFLSIIALVIFTLGIAGILWANLMGCLVVLVLTLWHIRKGIVWSLPRKSFVWEALKFGTPLVPAVVALSIVNWSDRIMLANLLPAETALNSVGIYSIAAQISTAVVLAVVGFKTWLGPYVYVNYQNHWAPKRFGLILEGYGILLFTMASFIISIIPELFQFFIDERYHASVSIVCWLIVAKVLYLFGDYSSVGIGIAKATYIRTFGGFGLAIINILLNIKLIPIWGIYGAVAATFVSFLAYCIYLQISSQRLYHIPISWPIMIILGGLLFGLIYTINLPLYYRLLNLFIILLIVSSFFLFRIGLTKHIFKAAFNYKDQHGSHG